MKRDEKTPQPPAPGVMADLGDGLQLVEGSAKSAEPAAEIDAPVPERSPAVLMLETPDAHDLLLKLIESFVGDYMEANPPTVNQDDLNALIDKKVEDAKSDILSHLTPMISAIVAEKTSAAPLPAAEIADAEKLRAEGIEATATALNAGDPVRVYQDADRKTFYTGRIVAMHDGGHAADVKIEELDAVSTVRIESLEYDERS